MFIWLRRRRKVVRPIITRKYPYIMAEMCFSYLF
jgi:hypothetical protein